MQYLVKLSSIFTGYYLAMPDIKDKFELEKIAAGHKQASQASIKSAIDEEVISVRWYGPDLPGAFCFK